MIKVQKTMIKVQKTMIKVQIYIEGWKFSHRSITNILKILKKVTRTCTYLMVWWIPINMVLISLMFHRTLITLKLILIKTTLKKVRQKRVCKKKHSKLLNNMKNKFKK
jgi:hypothetical protein